MKAAVRYYSRSGNTKAVADAIARAAGVDAVSVDGENAPLSEPADVLFIGGALYAYGIDKHLKEYLSTLKKGDAGIAVIFSTSWISKHAVELIRKGLNDACIKTADEFFYVRGMPDANKKNEAAEFAKKFI